MALSNWDTMAVDENGRSTNGVFTSKLGVTVEFYKNWLYVRDEKGWQDGGAYVKPTVMQIQSSDLTYKDVRIHATRGPKNGIYAVVYTSEYQKQPKPTTQNPKPAYVPPTHRAMIGIGCYGYGGEFGDEWVGIEEEEKKFLKDWINHSVTEDSIFYSSTSTETGEWVTKKINAGPHTHYDFDEWIRKIPLDGALRFNQGDAYFAQHLGFEVPATDPGAAEPTLMSQMLGNPDKVKE